MKFKKLVENWNKYTTNEVVDPEWQEVFDDIASDMGLGRSQPVARDIMINAGPDLDIQNILRLLQRAGLPSKMAEDPEFLVAWITGRLSHLGGPTLKRAMQMFGDHTKAKLFSKYKDFPTKYGKATSQQQTAKDLPADGLSPVDQSTYDVHSGGPESGETQDKEDSRVTLSQILPALKAVLDIDYSKGINAKNALSIMRIIATAIDSIERGK
jgi:hypothetical protein